MPYTYTNTMPAQPRPGPAPATLDEQTAEELVAACTACRMFIQRPSKRQAAEAMDAIRKYRGPIASRLLDDAARLLSARQRTALLAHALELYIRGEVTQTP